MKNCIAMALPALLAGCSVISVSPMPLWEASKFVGAGLMDAVEEMPLDPGTVVRHQGYPPVKQVCIEFNAQAPISDLVPKLQASLQQHKVTSRVYEAGTEPNVCGVWLKYRAQIDWGLRLFSSEQEQFLTEMELTMVNSRGQVMAVSHYRYDSGKFRSGQWSSLQSRVDVMVAAMVGDV